MSASFRLASTAVALLATVSGTQAVPVRLSCDGEMHALARNVSEKTSLALEIDAGKVKVGSNWGLSPISNEDDDTLTFGKGLEPTVLEPLGTINRITGAISVYIATLTDGVYNFSGKCRPAEKLF